MASGHRTLQENHLKPHWLASYQLDLGERRGDLVLVTPVLRSSCGHPYAKSGHTGQAVAATQETPLPQPQQIQL